MIYQVFDQPHMVPGVVYLEPDPVAGEDVGIGEIYACDEGDAEHDKEGKAVWGEN